MAEYVSFSASAPGFLLFPAQQHLSFTDDLVIRMRVRIDEWPENWAYLIAKYESKQLHEFLVRIKGETEGRWGYGDGSDDFKALKWNPGKYLTLGEWHELTFIRRMDGLSEVLADGVVIAAGEIRRSNEPAKTDAPITLAADSQGKMMLSAAIVDVDIFSGSALEVSSANLDEDLSVELGPWVQVGGQRHAQ